MWEVAKARLAQAAVWDDQLSLGLCARLLFKSFPAKQSENFIRHIVISRASNTATDILVAIPAMAAVRKHFPNAQITLLSLCKDGEMPTAQLVLEAFPDLVNRIVTCFPAVTKSIRTLQALKHQMLESGPIDLWVNLPRPISDFQRNAQEVVIPYWMRSRYAIGFATLLPDIFQRPYARLYKEQIIRTSDWLLGIVETELKIKTDATDYLNMICLSESWKPDSYGIDSERPLLAVNAGATLDIQRWPASHFQNLLNQVAENFPHLQIVLLGNEDACILNNHIAASLMRPSVNLAGKLSYTETWSLLNEASAILCNDTDTMHMAGLLRKPVFSPMSGQFPGPLIHPPGPPLIEFHKPVPCSPCFKTTCPLNEQICLTLLTPENIAPKILELLSTILD